jgi:hypothetical protein
MPGRSISLDSAADAVRRGIHVLVAQIDPPASPMWFLHTEPDGSIDLTTLEEPWYPVDPAGRDQVAG